MDNRYYDNLIGEMKPFLEENHFEILEDGSFANETKKARIAYLDAEQSYALYLADKTEDGFSEEAEVNRWLFDDSQNAKDAESVGMDFVNSLRKSLGIKTVRSAGGTVDLPTAQKNGYTESNLTKKMLDYFPNLKEEYKAYVAYCDGAFLPLHFYGKYIVPALETLFITGNKKQIKNLYSILSDAYIKADKDTVNLVVAMLSAAAYKNETVTAAIQEMLCDDLHFKQSFENFNRELSKNKKLMSVLVSNR